MLRFALHRQGQNCQVCTRCHGKPRRGLLLVLHNSGGCGYRLPELDLPDPTDNRTGALPALKDRVSTLGVR
jgi:hypothetical protein